MRSSKFIDKMVSKHGFDRQQLQRSSRSLKTGLRPASDGQTSADHQPPADQMAPRLRYRKQFITPDNVQNGA